MIEVNNVKEFSLKFETKTGEAFASITHWVKGEGWSVSFVEDDELVEFQISDEMLDALLNLHVYATTYKETKDESGN